MLLLVCAAGRAAEEDCVRGRACVDGLRSQLVAAQGRIETLDRALAARNVLLEELEGMFQRRARTGGIDVRVEDSAGGEKVKQQQQKQAQKTQPPRDEGKRRGSEGGTSMVGRGYRLRVVRLRTPGAAAAGATIATSLPPSGASAERLVAGGFVFGCPQGASFPMPNSATTWAYVWYNASL